MNDHRQLRNQAIYRVGEAIYGGRLPRLQKFGKSLGIKCFDCGKPAMHYDHRDYSKPLEVSPVCASCNYRRGPGRSDKLPNRSLVTLLRCAKCLYEWYPRLRGALPQACPKCKSRDWEAK